MQFMTRILTRQFSKSSTYFTFKKPSIVPTTLLCGAGMSTSKSPGVLKEGEDPKKVSDSDWKERLSDERYHVLREHGTERPFTGEYTFNKDSGTYHCGCCGVQLFSSDSKFESGCGWPSFYEALGREGRDESRSNVVRRRDTSHGMVRVEVLCKQCDAHLGHVFEDGPLPTGERFCINSVCLDFVPKGKKEKGNL